MVSDDKLLEIQARFAEVMGRILTTIQGAIDEQESAQALVDDLIEILAKQECKRHYDLPAWTKLTPQQKRRLLKGAEKTLLTIRDYWQEKIAAQEE